MEVNLQQKRKGLEVKIPDISKTLDVVRFLEARRVSARRLNVSRSWPLIHGWDFSANDWAQILRRYQNSRGQTTIRKAKQRMMT
jgi:hypothetical protein